MTDFSWIVDIEKRFKKERYILWLAPITEKHAPSKVEKQLYDLENNMKQTDTEIKLMFSALQHTVAEINEQLVVIDEKMTKM